MPYASAIPGVIGGGAGPFANAIPIILVDSSGNAVTLPAPATYGDGSNIPVITVGASGIITNISTTPVIGGGGGTSISQGGGTVAVDASGEVEITPNAGQIVDITLSANLASALQAFDGTTNYYTIDTRTTVSGVAAHTFTASPPTIASAAGDTYSVVSIPAITVTLTGSTLVTALNGLGLNLGIPTVTNVSADTVTTMSTLYVAGAPVVTGSQVGTNKLVAHFASGIFRNDGQIYVAAGSNGAPSIAYTSEVNTGFRFVTGTVVVVIQGTQPTFFDANGINTGRIIVTDGQNMVVGSTNGTKIGTATTQKLGFWNAAPIVQPVRGVTATNNVAASGTTDQFDDFTNGTVYATDYAALHATVSQLCRIVRIFDVNLRAAGLMS